MEKPFFNSSSHNKCSEDIVFYLCWCYWLNLFHGHVTGFHHLNGFHNYIFEFVFCNLSLLGQQSIHVIRGDTHNRLALHSHALFIMPPRAQNSCKPIMCLSSVIPKLNTSMLCLQLSQRGCWKPQEAMLSVSSRAYLNKYTWMIKEPYCIHSICVISLW